MANTGVLPFIRGVNFAKNDFSVSIRSETIRFLLSEHERKATELKVTSQKNDAFYF